MTTVLTDPYQDFLAQDPTVLHDPTEQLTPQEWAALPMDRPYKTVTDVSLGIGAAYLILHWLVLGRLRTRVNLFDAVAMGATSSFGYSIKAAATPYRRAWVYMVNPAIMHAFQLGQTQRMSYNDEVAYATAYSNQIFDYINDASAETLVKAYQAQLSDKWHPDVAWTRAIGGYGLDQRSMKQYVKLLANGEHDKIIPLAATSFVEKALHERARRIGLNEAQRATELGKTLAWMSQYQKGNLPRDAHRRWLTAEDERVCPICGPMDRVEVPMGSQFQLPDGNKLWAPGVHPNCRCSVELSYPARHLALAKGFQSSEKRDRTGRWVAIGGAAAGAAALAGGVLIARKMSAPAKIAGVAGKQISKPAFGANHAVYQMNNKWHDFTWSKPDWQNGTAGWSQRHPWLGGNDYAVEANDGKWRLHAEGFSGDRRDPWRRSTRYVFNIQGDVGDDLGIKLIRAHNSPEHQRALGNELDKVWGDNVNLTGQSGRNSAPVRQLNVSDAEVRETLRRALNRLDLPKPTTEHHLHAERLMRGEDEGTAALYDLATDEQAAEEESKHWGAAVLRGGNVSKAFDPEERRDTQGRWTAVAQEQETEQVTKPEAAPMPTAKTAPVRMPQVQQPVAMPQPVVMPAVKEQVEQAQLAMPQAKTVALPEVKTQMVAMPQAKPQGTKTEALQRPRQTLYAYANDLAWLKGSGDAWRRNADASDFYVGASVNLAPLSVKTDRGETRFPLRARTFNGTRGVVGMANDRYEDQPRYEIFDRTMKNGYHDAVQQFYEEAELQSEGIISDSDRLSYQDIRNIYALAGDDDLSHHLNADPSAVRETLKEDVQHSHDVRNAYLHYLEEHRPDAVGGTAGAEISAYRKTMAFDGLEPHTLVVLMFTPDSGFFGGFEEGNTGKALIHGQYEVYATKLVPLKPEMGRDAPSHIQAVKYVYVRPD